MRPENMPVTALTRLAGVALAAFLAAGCTAPPPTTAAAGPGPVGADPGAAAGAAAQLLLTLPVKGRAPKTGYDRDEFGSAWADVDRNGCDTRNDILRRDLRQIAVKAGTRGCVVRAGTLDDPYGGRRITFERGPRSAEVQIDHVVALSNAWQTGAQRWTEERRERFANDPLNLLAVDGTLNQRKSDGDAATWTPPRRGYWCAYGTRQVTVKARYGLWVTPAERAALARLLDRCPG
jgi:integrase